MTAVPQQAPLKTYDVIIGDTHVYVEACNPQHARVKACEELIDSGSTWRATYEADYFVREI